MLNNKETKSVFRRPTFWVVALLLIAVLTAGWLRWRVSSPSSPKLYYVMITVDGQYRKILPGERLFLHPLERVKITDVSTNIFFNWGVRLLANDFDINALQFEEMPLSDLLPQQEVFAHYKYRIWLKYRNINLGFMDWDVQPYAEDWLDEADVISNSEDRMAFLEKALRIVPEDKRIWRKLLEEYKTIGQWEKAAQLLEEAFKEGGSRETLIELLNVYTAIGRKADIISVLKRLLALEPNQINIRFRLAEALEEMGNIKGAIKEYKALMAYVDEEGKPSIYKRLGYLYAEAGQIKDAISFNQKAVRRDKEDANLYYNLFHLHEKIQQSDKAYQYLAKAVELNPDDVESRLKLAKRQIETGKLKEAQDYLSEVLEKEPHSIDALLLMARLLAKQGDKERLKQTYKKILSVDPRNETVIYNLGALEYEAGNLQESLSYFENYVKTQPQDAVAHEILFDIYNKEKRFEDAFKQAQIMIELRPDEVGYYRYIFDYLKGDYQRIIHIMEKGLKVNPDATELRDYLVFAYLKTGNEATAVRFLEKILKENPQDIEVLLHLARIYEKLGNPAKALALYGKVIELHPGLEEAEEAYLRLRLEGVQSDGQR